MKAAIQRLDRAAQQGAPSLPGQMEAAPAKPQPLPPEIESAVQAFEYANPERLGEASAEVLRRLLPFLHAVCRRLQIDLPVDKILQALKARRK
jgi:hypothetical protein